MASKLPIPRKASKYSMTRTDIQATRAILAAFTHPPSYIELIRPTQASSVIKGPRRGIHPNRNPTTAQTIAPKRAVIKAFPKSSVPRMSLAEIYIPVAPSKRPIRKTIMESISAISSN